MKVQISNVQETVSNTVGNTVNFVTGTAHKTFQFGLGAVVVAQDSAMGFVKNANAYTDKLAERGEGVEKNGRERFSGLVESRRNRVKDVTGGVTGKVGTAVNESSEAVLGLANVPTAADVEDLNKQVSSLGRKIDKMRKEQKELNGAVAA